MNACLFLFSNKKKEGHEGAFFYILILDDILFINRVSKKQKSMVK